MRESNKAQPGTPRLVSAGPFESDLEHVEGPGYGSFKQTNPDLLRLIYQAGRYRGEGGGEFNKGVPYQDLVANFGGLVHNLPREYVTWASHGANNDYLALAWDADSRYERPDPYLLIPPFRRSIVSAREAGHPIAEFTVHDAWANKGGQDPGWAFIRDVMVPIAEELGCLIDLDLEHGTGKSIRRLYDKEPDFAAVQLRLRQITKWKPEGAQ